MGFNVLTTGLTALVGTNEGQPRPSPFNTAATTSGHLLEVSQTEGVLNFCFDWWLTGVCQAGVPGCGPHSSPAQET